MRKIIVLLALMFCASSAFAADRIVSVNEAPNNNWLFVFNFDSGTGISDNRLIIVPAPKTGEYTAQQALAVAMPLAASAKKDWISNLRGSSIVGPVTLPAN